MMVERFVGLVEEYIKLVDSVSALSAEVFLRRCGILLPQLYAVGQQLPDVEPDDAEIPTDSVASPMKAIGVLLHEHDFYSEVFDPLLDKEVVTASLADDLADIYLDLQRPLTRFRSGTAADIRDAVWQWRFSIHGHCGDHLVDALRPIHRLNFDHGLKD